MRRYHSHQPYYHMVIVFMLATRIISEALTTFVWRPANHLWSFLALGVIGIIFWPILALERHRTGNIFRNYRPVFFYLGYLVVRMQVFGLYAMKCFFSEVIVWCIFIFTVEICRRSSRTARTIQQVVLFSVKLIALTGFAELVLFVVKTGIINPVTLFNARPVIGIFSHPNIFLVFMLPFLFYFTKRRSFFWTGLILIVCLATGTKSPFLALACLGIIIVKSVLKKDITRRDIVVSLAIFAATMTGIILYQLPEVRYFYNDLEMHSRLSLGTFQWRLFFWQYFLEYENVVTFIFGRGIGTADIYAGEIIGRGLFYPHNDYVRFFYDTGIVGLLILANLISFVIRRIKKYLTPENDYILLSYLLIVCFYASDNFMYTTLSLVIFMFIASYLNRHSQQHGYTHENTACQ